MIGSLIPQLSTLIVTVRKNVLSSVMTTVMILLIIVAWSARGNLAAWLVQNPTPTEQTSRMERGRESDANIAKALRADLQLTNADRILIRQFSDQIDSHSSVAIPYITTTHVVTAAGVSVPPAQISSMPRSYVSDLTNRVFPTGRAAQCIKLSTTEVRDEIFHRYLIDIGVFEMYGCPISDLNGVPVGIILASYLTPTKPRPTDQRLFEILSSTSTKVSGYLAEVTAPERDTWLSKLLSL